MFACKKILTIIQYVSTLTYQYVDHYIETLASSFTCLWFLTEIHAEILHPVFSFNLPSSVYYCA